MLSFLCSAYDNDEARDLIARGNMEDPYEVDDDGRVVSVSSKRWRSHRWSSKAVS